MLLQRATTRAPIITKRYSILCTSVLSKMIAVRPMSGLPETVTPATDIVSSPHGAHTLDSSRSYVTWHRGYMDHSNVPPVLSSPLPSTISLHHGHIYFEALLLSPLYNTDLIMPPSAVAVHQDDIDHLPLKFAGKDDGANATALVEDVRMDSSDKTDHVLKAYRCFIAELCQQFNMGHPGYDLPSHLSIIVMAYRMLVLPWVWQRSALLYGNIP
nr:hypothetical protein CFP56_41409 [Quercus suber]